MMAGGLELRRRKQKLEAKRNKWKTALKRDKPNKASGPEPNAKNRIVPEERKSTIKIGRRIQKNSIQGYPKLKRELQSEKSFGKLKS